MELGTDFVSPDKRITENDFRAGKLWVETPDEGSTDGWTWVGALLVAALFIVSGYLDQESGMSTVSSGAASSETYASLGSAPKTSVASVDATDRRADKGY